MDLVARCGSLVIGGFAGTSLPQSFARALRERRRGGAIFFRPNVEGGPVQVAALAREVHAASPDAPLVGVDQEGGRVARLRAPLLEVPPMRTVASWGDAGLAERIAHAVGAELGALGFTIDFAPVLDVNTCAENPVIGDRAFGDDPGTCARYGTAWIRGLQSAGVLACAKHFPGHGGTSKDSHVDMPVVERAAASIESVELAPFRAAVAAGVASMMTAHVMYPALDEKHPATLSDAICSRLRAKIGFAGMLVSDDLEMQAIAARWSIEEAAVQAVSAGCDALLVCWSDEKQERAVDALVREAERSDAFRARCEEACARTLAARRSVSAKVLDDEGVAAVLNGPVSRDAKGEIARRLQA
ncbi:MAG: beta-N-acetylhexosaminidase [Polyangiaceae bacterium]